MKAAIIFLTLTFSINSFANNLDEHKKTCSDLGFTKGTEKYGNCVLRLVKLARKNADMAVAQAESRRQQAEIAELRQIAEQAEKDRALDNAISIFGTIARGESIFAPPSRSASGASGLGGLRTCSYKVGTQTASQTQSASLPCPATMDFGGVSGFLIP